MAWEDRRNLQLGALLPLQRVSESLACWWTCAVGLKLSFFLESDVRRCGLGGPVKPSAGCCFPVSEGCQGFPRPSPACWYQFLWPMLVPIPLPFQDVLAGLETSFFSGAESDIRDCGLWFGGTGETFSWVLVSLFRNVSNGPQQGFPRLSLAC